MPQVVLQEVRKDYALGGQTITAVDSISLEMERGEFLSIVGHSGSGKTTLLSMLGGILSPSSGRILVDGIDLYALGENALAGYRADKVGYVFQFSSLLPVLTAKENLLLPTIFCGKHRDRAMLERRACEYLAMVGLSDRVDAYPSQLSGGQQRRVAIARAIMNDPSIILADEPTGDLDEETENEVMALFNRINVERGITFVLVTHSSELAANARRRIRMTQGRAEML